MQPITVAFTKSTSPSCGIATPNFDILPDVISELRVEMYDIFIEEIYSGSIHTDKERILVIVERRVE